jgi:ABC-type multidrug transport system ATPase subunit
MGRNGSGKTTLLKHIAAKVLDGIPWYAKPSVNVLIPAPP